MKLAHLALIPAVATFAACAGDAPPPVQQEQDFTSASAVLQEATFSTELLTDSWTDNETAIGDQLKYTVGLFNGVGGVSRLDKLDVSNIEESEQGDLKRVKYTVTLPVSIRESDLLPADYELVLPLRVDYQGKQEFYDDYAAKCVRWGADHNEVGIYWYYFRPERYGCELADEDVVRPTASVIKSSLNSLDKYPEHHKLWEDDALTVVAIFGKVDDYTTTEADRGIWSYNHFINELLERYPDAETAPETMPEKPGVDLPDVTINADLGGGRSLSVTVFLVDNVQNGGHVFEQRYNELSTEADFIAYNGHSGLGANIRKLATMGTFRADKYQIFYMNGCDTFAYIDDTLAKKRAELNPDDPTGSKFMEMLTNGLPPNWDSLPNNTLAFIDGIVKSEPALKYKELLATFDQSGIVAVTGEEDNVYEP